MIASKYNVYLDVSKGKALLNGITGAIDLCSEDTARSLQNGQIDQLPQELQDQLLKRGYLFNSNAEEDAYFEKASRYVDDQYVPVKPLVFVPSYNCNFRCPYCFEKWNAEKGEAWLRTVMTPEQVRNCYEILDTNVFGPIDNKVMIFGGEPLLPEHMETIRAILEEGSRRKVELYTIITNGYYLDAYLDLFDGYDIVLQITLDGPAEIHNRTRMLADGSGTFEKIAENVSKALEKGFMVRLRMNVGHHNASYMDALKEEAERRGWTGYKKFFLLFNNLFFDNEIKQQYVDGCPGYEMIFRTALSNHSRLLLTHHYCGAELPVWGIDPFGDVYYCLEEMGRGRTKFAHIDEDGLSIDLQLLINLRKRKPQTIKECSECPYVFICAGGCCLLAENKTGDYMKHCCSVTPDQIRSAAVKVINQFIEAYQQPEKMKSTGYLIEMTKTIFES